MGTQFSWFYDILVVAIVLGITFRCYKRGFVSSVVSLVSVLAGFIIALVLSGIIAPVIFDSFIRERAENQINESLDDMIDTSALLGLSGLDTSRILIGGVPIREISRTPDNVGNVNLDLTDVNLSNTGIDRLNLNYFGLSEDGLTSVNAGRTVITTSELSASEFETLVLARVLSSSIQHNSAGYKALEDAAETVGGILPQMSGGTFNPVSRLFVTAIESGETGKRGLTDVLIDSLVAPLIILPLRTLIFFVIFGIISIVLSLVARTLSIVNRIPIVGRVNTALGIVIGVFKSAIVVFLVCIGVNILIGITGNSIIFLNTMTIDESYIFRHVYNIDLINFGG